MKRQKNRSGPKLCTLHWLVIDFPNLGEGSPGEQQREDVGRVEADEAACVGPGLGLGLRLGEAEQTRG